MWEILAIIGGYVAVVFIGIWYEGGFKFKFSIPRRRIR